MVQKNLTQKIIEAKKNFPSIRKSGTNPHFKNRYMTLDEIVDAITPALSEQGILVYHTMHGGDLVTSITDGESTIDSFYPLRAENKNDQQLGSAISYGRRYSLCALLGIVADEDDDGNKASEPVSPQVQYLAKLRTELEGAKSDQDLQGIFDRWQKGKEKLSQLRIFDQGMAMIQDKLEGNK
jgi:hypothetical protein